MGFYIACMGTYSVAGDCSQQCHALFWTCCTNTLSSEPFIPVEDGMQLSHILVTRHAPLLQSLASARLPLDSTASNRELVL
jgi:hypothetical protein